MFSSQSGSVVSNSQQVIFSHLRKEKKRKKRRQVHSESKRRKKSLVNIYSIISLGSQLRRCDTNGKNSSPESDMKKGTKRNLFARLRLLLLAAWLRGGIVRRKCTCSNTFFGQKQTGLLNALITGRHERIAQKIASQAVL